MFTVENKTESVGQRIKQEAINIHRPYTKGTDVSAAAKIVMNLGLSSILDFTREEDVYQRCIFSNQEWKLLEDYFNKKYKFEITAQLAINRGNFTALKYISKIQSLESTSEVNFT